MELLSTKLFKNDDNINEIKKIMLNKHLRPGKERAKFSCKKRQVEQERDACLKTYNIELSYALYLLSCIFSVFLIKIMNYVRCL